MENLLPDVAAGKHQLKSLSSFEEALVVFPDLARNAVVSAPVLFLMCFECCSCCFSYGLYALCTHISCCVHTHLMLPVHRVALGVLDWTLIGLKKFYQADKS